MGTLPYRLVMVALVMLTTGCAARVPKGVHSWELRGAVTSAQNGVLEVRHKSGQIVRITTDERTVYVRGGKPVSSPSVAPHGRVKVEVEADSGVQRARRVHIFGASQ